MDSRDDADKLQGFQCGILWLEEVAPAAELAAGMPPPETLGIGGTSLRQTGIPRRILVTMNPPDEEHWIMKVEQTLGDLGMDEISVHRFVIPQGEKSKHFIELSQRPGITSTDCAAWAQAAREFDAYRKTNEALLMSINRQDLVSRLVKGQVRLRDVTWELRSSGWAVVRRERNELTPDATRCVEPRCREEGVVGLNGAWLCLTHFDIRFTAIGKAPPGSGFVFSG